MYKYQIIFLGQIDESIISNIESIFCNHIKELNIPKSAFVFLRNKDLYKYRGNQPAFAIYFGDTAEEKHKNIPEITRLIEDGIAILPVYFNKNAFHREIPECLHKQNGILYNSSVVERIVGLILESFHLLRSERKVFISYKRDESSSIAIQLFEALERNNFDVFLDTHSVRPGDQFQDELWHRMTDCDVVIVLNTKNFCKSEWCEEEIAKANAKQIGIVQLVWPKNDLENFARICVPLKLKRSDFKNDIFNDSKKSRFTDDIIEKIIETVESTRARNMAARQDSLITECMNIARKYRKDVYVESNGVLVEHINYSRLFIPAIGIPKSTTYNQSEHIANQRLNNKKIKEVCLIYDDIHIRDSWLKHLDWLNKYLEVKALKKKEFEAWIMKH